MQLTARLRILSDLVPWISLRAARPPAEETTLLEILPGKVSHRSMLFITHLIHICVNEVRELYDAGQTPEPLRPRY